MHKEQVQGRGGGGEKAPALQANVWWEAQPPMFQAPQYCGHSIKLV